MDEIAQTSFCSMSLDPSRSYLVFRWISRDYDMTFEDFKEALLLYVVQVKTYSVRYVLVDTIDLSYIVDSSEIAWIDTYINGPTHFYLSKMAVVLPSIFQESNTIAQALDEKEGLKINVRYFHTEKEGHDWLFSV